MTRPHARHSTPIRTKRKVAAPLRRGSPRKSDSVDARKMTETAEITSQVLSISFAGAIAVILALSGVAAFFVAPDASRDIWLIIGPIVSTAIFGLLRLPGTISNPGAHQKTPPWQQAIPPRLRRDQTGGNNKRV